LRPAETCQDPSVPGIRQTCQDPTPDGYQPPFSRSPYLTSLSACLSPRLGLLRICSSIPSSAPGIPIFFFSRRDPTMAATCGTALSGARLDSKLASSFLPRTAGLSSSSSCGLNNGAFRAGAVVSMPLRRSLHVVAMAPPKPSGKAKKGMNWVLN